MAPRDFAGKAVVITGGAGGIGMALARAFGSVGSKIAIIDLASSPLREAQQELEAAGIEAVAIPCDITARDQVPHAMDAVRSAFGGIDVLINNAGVSYRAVVEHVEEHERLAQMDVNFRSPMELIRLVLPTMREKRAGRIITVSSVGGMMAMPTMAAYSASKFALEGAHEALWYEVRPWGIGVSLVQPGFVDSDGFQKVRYTPKSGRSEHELAEPYHEHYVNMAPFIERLMKLSPATPESVANVVLKTLRRRRPPLRIPATVDARWFSLLRRILPRNAYHWLLYQMLPRVDEWGPSPKRLSSLPKPPDDVG